MEPQKICEYVKPLVQSEIRGELTHEPPHFVFRSRLAIENEKGEVETKLEYAPQIIEDPLLWFDLNSVYIDWRKHEEAIGKIEEILGLGYQIQPI